MPTVTLMPQSAATVGVLASQNASNPVLLPPLMEMRMEPQMSYLSKVSQEQNWETHPGESCFGKSDRIYYAELGGPGWQSSGIRVVDTEGVPAAPADIPSWPHS